MKKFSLYVAFAVLCSLPGLALRALGIHLTPFVDALLAGAIRKAHARA
ncbi:MAG: hypothetical protein HYX63_10790 [Gammaproteobacteria bacterium]|nr:hypothetical protein [Gammaproteobacteria bacterium]